MLLATPASGEKLHELSGSIRLLGPSGMLFEQRFGPNDLVPANWLDRNGRASVIIGKGPQRMDEVIAHNPKVEVELLLDQPPGFPLELWASWLTSRSIERDAAAAARSRKRE